MPEVQGALGSVLSSEGLHALLNIYDNLKLEPAAILMLVNWCVARVEERYGPGHRPSMRAVEKEAYIWEREGAVTVEAAALLVHKRSGLLARENIASFALPALFVSAAASLLAARLPSRVLRAGFGCFLIVLSLFRLGKSFFVLKNNK